MRKFISLMMVLFTATSVTFALEGGKITPSKASFGPTETVTLTYDGTGTNFANWQPLCFVHAWLVAAEGQTFSKSYGTDWASCNGDADYAALDAKLKMTFVSKGVYTIDMNIKDFFDVAEADLAKIGKLGIIVRAQYEGDKNQTEDMFLNVGSEQEVTLYFVKPDDWNGVMAYVYDKGGYYKDYPGEEMVKTDKKLKGKDVYSYTFPEKYNMIGFVSKDGERNTGNYAWNTTIPYYYDDGDGYAGNNWWAEDDLVDQMTVYFFNSLDWAKVNTFVWPESGNAYKNWPGQAAKKETEQIHGKDVYAYSFPVTYVNVIFNNGDKQTVDLKWDADKPYFVPGETDSEGKYKGTWYAKADIPAPEVPAKYYVTGDTALVIAAGVDKMKAWQPNAIKSEADTLELNLAAGDYVLKLTLDGTWAEGKARGYSNLTAPAAEGLSADKDDNICFKLTEAGIVKVIYFVAEEKETFKLEGKFYVKPVVKKELNLVPGVWANDKAQIAAWIWGAELEGQWTAFFAGKDTLKAEINAAADSIVFVRFNDQVAAPTWDNEATNVWNKMAGDTIDYAGLTYTITDWAKGQWTVYVPEVPAKYYVTGDTALVVAAGVDKMKAWQPNAIKSEADTLELNLAAGDYVLKLTLDGTWAEGKARGYSNLTAPAAEGLSADKDDNICFKLTEAGIVKVIYFVAEEKETFKLEGKFYVKPVVKKELNLVPGVWANDKAQIAAWIWGAELEGQWTAFFAGKDTLKAEINAAADSIVFVRFNDQVAAPTWDNEATNVWNKMAGDTIDYAGLTYTITDWAKGQWTVYVPEVPAKYYVTGDTALVVAAGVDKMKAWQPNAIKSEADTLELNLAAGDYVLKLTLDGTWAEGKARGYSNLTAPAAEGLSADKDDNICFKLTEAGIVKVIYFVAEEKETFKLEGKFYVAPVEKKYYAKNNWGAGTEWTWKEMTKDDEDSYYLQAVFGGTGVNINTAESEEGQLWFAAKDIDAFLNDDYYTETTLEAKDTVIFYYTPSEEMLAALVIGKYVPTLADGFYLVGTFNGVDAWNLSDLSAEKLFKATDVEGQYSIDVTLMDGDHFKAIKVEKDAIIQWYPDGTDNDYVVDASHAGQKTIYFRPSFWQDWNGHFYVAPNGGDAINNINATKAVKVLRDGQIMIIKGNKTFNVLGAEIR